jgi:hypothetical protein
MEKKIVIILFAVLCFTVFSIDMKLEEIIDYKTTYNSITWGDNKTFYNGHDSELYKYNLDEGKFIKILRLFDDNKKCYNSLGTNQERNIILCIITEYGLKNIEHYILYNISNNFLKNQNKEKYLNQKIKILKKQSRGETPETYPYWEIDLINSYRLAYWENEDAVQPDDVKSFMLIDQYGKEILTSKKFSKGFHYTGLSQVALSPVKNRLLISGSGWYKNPDSNKEEYHQGLWLFHIIYDSEITKDNALLFENADTNSKQIKVLKKGSVVDIYERSNNEVEYEGKKDFLYQIQLKDGTKGWCFGDYLRVEYPIERIVGEKVIFYNPKVDKLRLREKQGHDGKVMKFLMKTDKLELVGLGQEATIDKIKGRWVKVRTEQGEIGWCFDGYLEEVE